MTRWTSDKQRQAVMTRLSGRKGSQRRVIAHISGVSGAGKSTLLKRMKTIPGLAVKDLDDFTQFPSREKSRWAGANVRFQRWLGKQTKPIVLGGFYNMNAVHLPADRRDLQLPHHTPRLVLNRGPLRSAWQHVRYRRKMPLLSRATWKEGYRLYKDNRADWRGYKTQPGFQRMSAKRIEAYVQEHL